MNAEVLKSKFNLTKKEIWSVQCKFHDLGPIFESQCSPCLMFNPPSYWKLTKQTVSYYRFSSYYYVILVCVMRILSRNLYFMPRDQLGKVPYYSNFMRKIIQKFLKMNWTLGKSSTLNSSLVSEGKKKLYCETNHKHWCQLGC